MNKILSILLFVFSIGYAKDPYVRNTAIDVRQYVFQIEVNDSTDFISGRADVLILFKKPVKEFELDLVSKDGEGRGMGVVSVSWHGTSLAFTHKNDRLKIELPTVMKVNQDEKLVFGVCVWS